MCVHRKETEEPYHVSNACLWVEYFFLLYARPSFPHHLQSVGYFSDPRRKNSNL